MTDEHAMLFVSMRRARCVNIQAASTSTQPASCSSDKLVGASVSCGTCYASWQAGPVQVSIRQSDKHTSHQRCIQEARTRFSSSGSPPPEARANSTSWTASILSAGVTVAETKPMPLGPSCAVTVRCTPSTQTSVTATSPFEMRSMLAPVSCSAHAAIPSHHSPATVWRAATARASSWRAARSCVISACMRACGYMTHCGLVRQVHA
eukprot:364965-Chlamydomonas_euryale.AAC.11